MDSNSDGFKLEETDIPGAKLQKPVEQCTVAVLNYYVVVRKSRESDKI